MRNRFMSGKRVGTAAGLTIILVTTAAFAATKENCTAMWKKADASNTGKISGDMAKPYIMAMDTMKTPAASAKDGVVKSDEFLAACMKDAFKGMK